MSLPCLRCVILPSPLRRGFIACGQLLHNLLNEVSLPDFLTLAWIFTPEILYDFMAHTPQLRSARRAWSEKTVVLFFPQKEGPIGDFPLSRLLCTESTVYAKVAFRDRSLGVVEGPKSVPVGTTHHVGAVGRRAWAVSSPIDKAARMS